MQVDYAIIGAGPTGLGAAHRLSELGAQSFVVLERNHYAGGLAASFTDPKGYTWDIGGHVVFSHYEYFDRLVEGLLGADVLRHQRVAAIRARDAWVPYPFQNNIRHLPRPERWQCVEGLLPGKRPEHAPRNFEEWIHCVFGQGIGEVFLWPYNFKVWATPPRDMNTTWVGERVSMVDLAGVLKNILLELDDAAWGPNNTFLFPAFGGTGEIYRRLARSLGERIRYGQSVVRVDAAAKALTLASGETIHYKALLSTGPLDRLVLDQLAAPSGVAMDALRLAAGRLKHNSVHVSGVGVDDRPVGGATPDARCWMYFPEDNCPFYRVTNFHNYSPQNPPGPGRRAFMCETSYSGHKPEDLGGLMENTITGLGNVGLLEEAGKGRIESRFELTVDYGYPVPCLERDAALRALQPVLEAQRIYSRGRFGGWKYEVSNMDHSVMQGVEWAELMLNDTPERTYSWK